MTAVAQGFEPTAESVGAARRYAVSSLRLVRAESLQDDVRTVVSELATNAVLHAQTVFTVSVSVVSRRLHIAVTDGSPTRPRPSRLRDQQASTGRGLHIVAELSAAWGVEPAGAGGKTIWCDLPLPGDDAADRSSAGAGELADVDDLEALLASFDDEADSPAGHAAHGVPVGSRPAP